MILGLLLMVLNSPVRGLCDHCLKVTLVKEVFFLDFFLSREQIGNMCE